MSKAGREALKKSRARLATKQSETTIARAGTTARSATGRTREQMQAEFKKEQLTGIATQQTKTGRFLRGETVKTSTGARINVRDDPERTGLPGAQPTAQPQFGTGTFDGGAGGSFGTFGVNKEFFDRVTAEGIENFQTNPEFVRAWNEGRVKVTSGGMIDRAKEALGLGSLGWEHVAASLGIPLGVQGINAMIANVLGLLTPVGTLTKVIPSVTTQVQVNGKTVKIVQTMLAGAVTQKATSGKFWTALQWAAGASLLGLWGGAEAPEPVVFTLSKIEKLAQKTDDWTLYDEASETAKELADVPMWLYPIFGIPNKIKGIKENIGFLDRYVNELREFNAGGGVTTGAAGDEYMSSPAAWEARDERNHQRDLDSIAAFEASKERLIKLEADADADAAKLWAKMRRELIELQAKMDKENVENWIKYQKFIFQMQENNRPSALNFGLL